MRIFLVLCCIVVLVTVSAMGQPVPRTVIEVDISRAETARLLFQGGFDVDHAAIPGRVQVYATLDELRRIESAGISFQVVGKDPDPPVFGPAVKALGSYNDYNGMLFMLQAWAAAYPAITRLVSLGDSVQGRALWAMRITDNPDVDEAEPEFKYVATMHGNEPVGTELCLYFIDYLLRNYGKDTTVGRRVTPLVDTTAIWVVPLMNPDGLMLGSRYNANGVDLNRGFPSLVQDGANGNIFNGDPLDDAGREPEIRHVMHWTIGNSFVLSANYHAGALVANYPYDEAPGPPNVYATAPDDTLFIHLATVYSVNNPPMYNSRTFENGITNGAAWYTAYGGMQDWNLRYASCMELTLEVSVNKKPPASTLPTFWENNRESMLAYLEQVHEGVRGVVTDTVTGQPLYARVWVGGNAQPVYSDPDAGDYYRILLPGQYTFVAEAPGYRSGVAYEVSVAADSAVTVDFALAPFGSEGEGEGEDDGEGEPGPNCEGISSTQAPMPLGAPGTSLSGLYFPDSLLMDDLNLWVHIDHPGVESLALSLLAPSGTFVSLVARGGGQQGRHFLGTQFDDEADTAVEAGAAPYAGSFRPTESLAAFDGENAQGFWTLVIQDDGTNGAGVLKAWRLCVEGTPPGGEGEGEGEGEIGPRCDPAVHAADQNTDGRITLGELLRIVQFFSAGGLHCATTLPTEDGYLPGPGLTTECCPHDSDYNGGPDWRVSLTELLRGIQLYNSDGYHPCPNGATEDGFCTGAPTL